MPAQAPRARDRAAQQPPHRPHDRRLHAHRRARCSRARRTRCTASNTTDTALKSGRTGWRRLRRTYADFAALPAANVCAQVRAYVRNGYRHTPATRRAMRAFHAMMAWDTRDVDRRMAAAVSRLVELGIPAAEADAFDGELGE